MFSCKKAPLLRGKYFLGLLIYVLALSEGAYAVEFEASWCASGVAFKTADGSSCFEVNKGSSNVSKPVQITVIGSPPSDEVVSAVLDATNDITFDLTVSGICSGKCSRWLLSNADVVNVTGDGIIVLTEISEEFLFILPTPKLPPIHRKSSRHMARTPIVNIVEWYAVKTTDGTEFLSGLERVRDSDVHFGHLLKLRRVRSELRQSDNEVCQTLQSVAFVLDKAYLRHHNVEVGEFSPPNLSDVKLEELRSKLDVEAIARSGDRAAQTATVQGGKAVTCALSPSATPPPPFAR